MLAVSLSRYTYVACAAWYLMMAVCYNTYGSASNGVALGAGSGPASSLLVGNTSSGDAAWLLVVVRVFNLSSIAVQGAIVLGTEGGKKPFRRYETNAMFFRVWLTQQ